MSDPQIRAVILAAGRGTRLRPLTAAVPKPLLPVVGRPLVEHTLERLVTIGCEAAALNLHHLADQVSERLGERFGPLALTYSAERSLLGTLGALGPLRDFLAPADLILVINGDSLCRWPLERLIERHLDASSSSAPAATLLFSRGAEVDAFGGGVRIDGAGEVRAFRGAAASRRVPGHVRRVFAGAHILSRELLDRVPAGPSDFVTDLYEPLLMERAILRAVESDVPWHDLGTPYRYLEGVLDWQSVTEDGPVGDDPGRRDGSSWVANSAAIDPDSRLLKSVIEAEAVVEAGAELEYSLILPGARVGAGCRVTGGIVGPRVELPPGTEVERRLVTLAVPGEPLPPAAMVAGGQVFTPIGG